jgi:hypothetical protein
MAVGAQVDPGQIRGFEGPRSAGRNVLGENAGEQVALPVEPMDDRFQPVVAGGVRRVPGTRQYERCMDLVAGHPGTVAHHHISDVFELIESRTLDGRTQNYLPADASQLAGR